MERNGRFEHFRFLGDKRTQVVYDVDETTDDETMAKITEVAESEITVDFNHPLIGRDCIYEMDLVGFVNSTREQTAKDPAT